MNVSEVFIGGEITTTWLDDLMNEDLFIHAKQYDINRPLAFEYIKNCIPMLCHSNTVERGEVVDIAKAIFHAYNQLVVHKKYW